MLAKSAAPPPAVRAMRSVAYANVICSAASGGCRRASRGRAFAASDRRCSRASTGWPCSRACSGSPWRDPRPDPESWILV